MDNLNAKCWSFRIKLTFYWKAATTYLHLHKSCNEMQDCLDNDNLIKTLIKVITRLRLSNEAFGFGLNFSIAATTGRNRGSVLTRIPVRFISFKKKFLKMWNLNFKKFVFPNAGNLGNIGLHFQDTFKETLIFNLNTFWLTKDSQLWN